MAPTAWQFWEILDDGGELRWLGITRPRGRTELERATVWTLIPRTRARFPSGTSRRGGARRGYPLGVYTAWDSMN